jgi:large subunit ribosomal protein L9
MKVILLEKVENLGSIGDSVDVRSGYARNFLLPQGKALRSTKENIAYFESKKSEIEAKNSKLRSEAEKLAETMKNISIVLIRQASDSGFLFGSVRPGDIVSELAAQNVHISKSQLKIKNPLKTIGTYQIGIQLHPEVIVDINLRIEMPRQQSIANDEVESDDSMSDVKDNGNDISADAVAEVPDDR